MPNSCTALPDMVEVRNEFLLNGWSEKEDELKENLRTTSPVFIKSDYHVLSNPMDLHPFQRNVLCNSKKCNKPNVQVILLKLNNNSTKEFHYKFSIHNVVANLRVLSEQQGTLIRIHYPFSP